MDRRILGFVEDEQGDWVAVLDCGHGQHMRHRPPFVNRPWVLDADGREAHRGAVLDCLKCDRGESPVFDVQALS